MESFRNATILLIVSAFFCHTHGFNLDHDCDDEPLCTFNYKGHGMYYFTNSNNFIKRLQIDRWYSDSQLNIENAPHIIDVFIEDASINTSNHICDILTGGCVNITITSRKMETLCCKHQSMTQPIIKTTEPITSKTVRSLGTTVSTKNHFNPTTKTTPELDPTTKFSPTTEFNPTINFSPKTESMRMTTQSKISYLTENHFNPTTKTTSEFNPTTKFNPTTEFSPTIKFNPKTESMRMTTQSKISYLTERKSVAPVTDRDSITSDPVYISTTIPLAICAIAGVLGLAIVLYCHHKGLIKLKNVRLHGLYAEFGNSPRPLVPTSSEPALSSPTTLPMTRAISEPTLPIHLTPNKELPRVFTPHDIYSTPLAIQSTSTPCRQHNYPTRYSLKRPELR